MPQGIRAAVLEVPDLRQVGLTTLYMHLRDRRFVVPGARDAIRMPWLNASACRSASNYYCLPFIAFTSVC
jgi:hypothetical protein